MYMVWGNIREITNGNWLLEKSILSINQHHKKIQRTNELKINLRWTSHFLGLNAKERSSGKINRKQQALWFTLIDGESTIKFPAESKNDRQAGARGSDQEAELERSSERTRIRASSSRNQWLCPFSYFFYEPNAKIIIINTGTGKGTIQPVEWTVCNWCYLNYITKNNNNNRLKIFFFFFRK